MDAQSPRAARIVGFLDRAAPICLLLTVPLLMHAHGIAEATVALVCAAFLARSFLTREWAWVRAPWFLAAMAWWGWIAICSAPIPALGLGEGGGRSFGQALGTIRFPLLAAAIEHHALRDPAMRRWLWRVVAVAAAYIAAHSVVQAVVGRSLYGWPRYVDGELTGPFGTPRAGPPLARILMPAALPPAMALLARGGAARAIGAFALLGGGLFVVVLIGQRMPAMLAVGSLAIAALLIRRARLPVAAAGALAGLLLLAAPTLAPDAHRRLVVKFSNQMENFGSSHYGQLYARAWQVGLNNTWTGLGHDGFATGCPRSENFRPSFDGTQPDGGGAAICWVHPHNFYLQALTDGGFPGLVLFSAMAGAMLVPLARGLWRDPDPLRAALFASVAIQLWPMQSTSSFVGMPMGGWFFLLLGWGLAEARARA